MLTKIRLVDRVYLCPGAMTAAHMESYRTIHSRPLPWHSIKWAGIVVGVVAMAYNIPAITVVGAMVAWYAAGRAWR